MNSPLKLTTRQSVSDLLKHKNTVIDLLPHNMEEVTKLDAVYHADMKQEWIDSNQVDSERNINAHAQVWSEIEKHSTPESCILELGASVGFDAAQLAEQGVQYRSYILSEISSSLLEYARDSNPLLSDKPVLFCALDANEILIEDNQLDLVFMIATLHHFPNLMRSLAEINRITKAESRIIAGIEPNRRWSKFLIVLRPLYRQLFPQKAHSEADEEAEGYLIEDFEMMAKNFGWQIEKIVPVWLLTGFLHYGLEGIYRIFRLNSRIRLPKSIERLFLGVDSLLFKLPYIKELAWHYTVVFHKTLKAPHE